MKPELFIVGAPKCGTTALCEYLRTHPSVFISRPKEPFFFCDDLPGLPGVKSAEQYDALFREVPPGTRIAGEGSAVYLCSDVALERIRAFSPGARIIVMLRNPIELAPSFHSQLLYNRTEDEQSFERAWSLQDERAQGRSIPALCREPAILQYRRVARLGEQVERLFSIFPREQVLLIFFEDFRRSPREVYLRVLDFLGVPDDGRTDFPRVNENKSHRLGALARFTQHPPRILSAAASAARRLLGRRDLVFLGPIRRANASVGSRAPLSSEMRRQLADEFSSDVEQLARLTGRDLCHWLSPESSRAPRASSTDHDR
jgi:hypothetical protein